MLSDQKRQMYLAESDVIDFSHPAVKQQAVLLAEGCAKELDIVRRCFEFVRDEISHCIDAGTTAMPVTASEVLLAGTGYCYAKSHLLAALLRTNDIPAGLCYQRLTVSDDRPPFCLHGLNAVWLAQYGWFRIDARGNNDIVNAQFKPPVEQLAYPLVIEGEIDLPEIWPEPLNVVRMFLQSHSDAQKAVIDLPDVELW